MDDCYVINPNCQFPSYWIIKKHIEEVVGQCDTCICNAKDTACKWVYIGIGVNPANNSSFQNELYQYY